VEPLKLKEHQTSAANVGNNDVIVNERQT